MTPTPASAQPVAGEYAPYFEKYISLVPAGSVTSALQSQAESSLALLQSVTEEKGGFAYAPGKWTVKEVVGHLSDSERIFGYRLLRISRCDLTPIEGFEQDDYVRWGPFRNSTLASLVDDFAAVRRSTLTLLGNLEPEAWLRRGVANKHEVSVRALAYMIAGHELHHMAILREKYLR